MDKRGINLFENGPFKFLFILSVLLFSFIFVLATSNTANVSEINTTQEINLPNSDNNKLVQNNVLKINTGINDSEINNLTNNTWGNESIMRNNISLSFRPRVEDIIEVKIIKEEVPKEIIKSTEEYIRSFVNEDNFNKNFRFDRAILFRDSTKNSNEYLIIYDFRMNYIRSNGKMAAAGSDIRIIADENGNILNPSEVLAKYNNFILKKI